MINIYKYAALISIFLIVSCSPVVEELVDDGWIAFENGDYSLSRSIFLDAIDAYGKNAKGYSGLGWSYMKLDSIYESISSFDRAISLDTELMEAYAGISLIDMDYNNVIDKATVLIDSRPDYVFSHDSSVTIEDIYLSRAHAYICRGNFSLALYDVQSVDPDFNADISTQQGRLALVQKLEELLLVYRTP